jgi:hypothetical protein
VNEFEFIVEELIALHISGVYANHQEQQELHRQHMVFCYKKKNTRDAFVCGNL